MRTFSEIGFCLKLFWSWRKKFPYTGQQVIWAHKLCIDLVLFYLDCASAWRRLAYKKIIMSSSDWEFSGFFLCARFMCSIHLIFRKRKNCGTQFSLKMLVSLRYRTTANKISRWESTFHPLWPRENGDLLLLSGVLEFSWTTWLKCLVCIKTGDLHASALRIHDSAQHWKPSDPNRNCNFRCNRNLKFPTASKAPDHHDDRCGTVNSDC